MYDTHYNLKYAVWIWMMRMIVASYNPIFEINHRFNPPFYPLWHERSCKGLLHDGTSPTSVLMILWWSLMHKSTSHAANKNITARVSNWLCSSHPTLINKTNVHPKPPLEWQEFVHPNAPHDRAAYWHNVAVPQAAPWERINAPMPG